jgi:hypothetical protein
MDHDEYEAGKFRHRAFITRRPESSPEIEGLISRFRAIDTNIGGGGATWKLPESSAMTWCMISLELRKELFQQSERVTKDLSLIRGKTCGQP